MDVFDVIVVGAGPAGSLAAEQLAANNSLKVGLIDGRPSDEPKACGGGVTSKALKAWPQLTNAESRSIDEIELCAPSGRGVRFKLDQPFAIYSRKALDAYLRCRAQQAGAMIFTDRAKVLPRQSSDENWIIRGTTTGVTWKASYLVAADGANSAIARSMAGPLQTSEMEVAFGYRTPLPKSGEAITTIAFLPGWSGYAWAFPRLDHISFGIATTQDAFDHQALDIQLWNFMVGYYRRCIGPQTRWQSSSKQCRRELVQDAQVEEKLKASAERYAARIPGLSFDTLQKRKTVGENWALLGDAAGFADSITGEGIYYALRSAELFATAFLSGQPKSYETSWRKDFGGELSRASQMRGRFYGSFLGAEFTERMVELARVHPGVRRTLRNLVAGDQGYTNLKAALVRSALWPF